METLLTDLLPTSMKGKLLSDASASNHANLVIPMYVEGSATRLFLNTSLGCSSSCSYCYLPSIGLPVGSRIRFTKAAHQIAAKAVNHPTFLAGRNGTILSVGCYTECWDARVRESTKHLLMLLLPIGNPIQMATKRRITQDDLSIIRDRLQWPGQFSVFASCSTITRWRDFEKGTIPPFRRFQSFPVLLDLGIPTFLYIKPVIETITAADASLFAGVISRYGIAAVVGDLFSDRKTNAVAPIGNGRLYREQVHDADSLIDFLKRYCAVYRTSVDAVNMLRRRYTIHHAPVPSQV